MNKNKIKFLVVTYTPTIRKNDQYYSYSPYVDEMNVWFEHADESRILSPLSYPEDFLNKPFDSADIKRYYIPFIAFNNLWIAIKSLISIPVIAIQMIRAMTWANHIHFRSPGNVTLIGSFVQILFPFKMKTVKYAGNWDPNSKQPLSYRIQKAIFRNTWLSKNIKVLVYGEWPNETKNVYPFISATYKTNEIISFRKRNFRNKLKFVFIGAMVIGKRPFLTVAIIQELIRNNIDAELHMFGDGPLIDEVKTLIGQEQLDKRFFVYGNQPKKKVKECLKDAHFTILPSKSEGWPKAIAEGMFFGAIPISTKISCLPWILDYGKRGILIEPEVKSSVNLILKSLEMGDTYLNTLSKGAQEWSSQYTVNRLENEIRVLVKG